MALAQSLVSCGSDAVLADGGVGGADRNSPFDAGRDQALGAKSMDAGLDQPMGGIDSPSVDAGGTLVPTWADDRVRALIGQMTVAEKIAQLQNTAPSIDRLKLPAYQ
jgi:hypothetical protein